MIKALIITGICALTQAISIAGVFPESIPGKLLHYHFDDGAGTTAKDFSNRGSPCTFGGTAPVWVTGLFGKGLQLISGQCKTGAIPSLTDFTIAVWTKPGRTAIGATGDGGQNIFGQWPVGYASFFALRIMKGYVASDCAQDSPVTFFGTVQVSTGAWHLMVVVRRAGSNRELWLDGKLDTISPASTSGLGTQAMNFGQDENGANMDYLGVVDEAMLLGRAATPGEIRDWYGSGLGRHAQEAP